MANESFTARAVGHTGRVLGSVTSTSVDGAMQKADRELPDAWEVTVRGEYTSDGTHHGPGGGRSMAVKEGGKWRRYNPGGTEIRHAVVPWKQGGRYTLDEAIAWDRLAAANERLYFCTTDGAVVSYGEATPASTVKPFGQYE